jgi:hypothetical protein
MDVDFYPDEDWEVDSVIAKDVCAITLRSPDGSRVRIEATYSVLAEIGRRWVNELSVTANGRNPDAILDLAAAHAAYKRSAERIRTNVPGALSTLDAIDAKIDNLETLLRDYHAEKGEELRYPADMIVGDWVRFPPSHAWRRIDVIHEDNELAYMFGGLAYTQKVRPMTRYPYMTAAAMAAVPKQEA